jgi:DNA-binding response OmpR family regulator
MVKKSSFTSKVLVINNIEHTEPLLMSGLREMGLDVVVEPVPTNALQRWSEEIPDLIVIDENVPETQAIELIKNLRSETVVPIILLTQFNTDDFPLAAYAAGVDECIVKPINSALFYAKVKVWLRRAWSVPADTLDPLRVGRFLLLPSDRTIIFDDSHPIRLTNLELRLLYCLMSQPNHTLTIEDLNFRVWGYNHETDNTMLKNVVYRLRRKIEREPAHPLTLETVAGVGYKFAHE